jgi:RNA polymerase sigma factor (sigma-70 family)
VTVEHSAPEAALSEVPNDPGQFFTDHYMPVMRLCMRHLRDESDAEDAVQEVFRRAVQRHAELHGNPLPWLITVAKNVCRDELRRRRNGWTAVERSAAMAPAEEASTAVIEDNPERLVVGQLFVRELLGRLTPAERRVVAARVYEGASGADAAQAMGVAGSTTRVLLARARQKLRTYLEEGQGAFAGVWLFGLRTVHGVRRHLLERPWTGEAGAALLLPAALAITVMMGPGSLAPAIAGGAASASSAGAGSGAVHDARTAADASALVTTILVRHQAPPATHSASSPSAGGPSDSLVPPLKPDLQRVAVTDVEPSPNYSSDHTVLMLGTTLNCSPPPCTQLFRSTDSGATWTYVGAPGLDGTTLILPPSSFAQGTFYTSGPVGLQMTTNGGSTFINAVPLVSGYAVAAPAWSGLGVLLSNNALWQLSDGLFPKSMSLFPANQQAVGTPLTLQRTGGGFDVLQPISAALSLTKATEVLHCTPVCGGAVTLPFYSTHTALIPSPDVATDQTVYAVGYGAWLAVSHDGGQSFGAARSVRISQLLAVPFDGGRRLVAIINSGTSRVLQVSDDEGATWRTAGIDAGLNLAADDVLEVSSLASGRLIASMQRSDRPTYFGFACSRDGSVWTSCTSATAR